MPIAYIAGPMTGLPDFNFPAFRVAASEWRANGWEVKNPAESFDGRTDLPRERYIRHDLGLLMEVDAVVVLPGWQRGTFAAIEVAIARELGLPVYDARYPDNPTPYQETVLEEAERLVMGDRGAAYGHPADDFAIIGRIWGAILGVDDIPADKVGHCLIGLKLARDTYKPKRDNLTDIGGYARCIERIREREAHEPLG